MDLQDAITANYMQGVISPIGQVFRKGFLVSRMEHKDAMWTSAEVLGVWKLATVEFTATVQLHADGGILLHPETGGNFFLELLPLSGNLVTVNVVTKESQ